MEYFTALKASLLPATCSDQVEKRRRMEGPFDDIIMTQVTHKLAAFLRWLTLE